MPDETSNLELDKERRSIEGMIAELSSQRDALIKEMEEKKIELRSQIDNATQKLIDVNKNIDEQGEAWNEKMRALNRKELAIAELKKEFEDDKKELQRLIDRSNKTIDAENRSIISAQDEQKAAKEAVAQLDTVSIELDAKVKDFERQRALFLGEKSKHERELKKNSDILEAIQRENDKLESHKEKCLNAEKRAKAAKEAEESAHIQLKKDAEEMRALSKEIDEKRAKCKEDDAEIAHKRELLEQKEKTITAAFNKLVDVKSRLQEYSRRKKIPWANEYIDSINEIMPGLDKTEKTPEPEEEKKPAAKKKATKKK